MKLQLHPDLIFRVPQFSFQQPLAECWESLKASIATASPDFYVQIKDLSYNELMEKDISITHTVWKYFNRARFRATPYGSFAGLGTARVATGASQQLTISNNQVLHTYPDWNQKNNIQYNITDLISSNAKVMANSSHYLMGNSIRYLYCQDAAYEIAELPFDEVKLHAVRLCKAARPVTELLAALGDMTDKEGFVEMLLIDQLLIAELHPNTIGREYFARCGVNVEADKLPYIIAERPLLAGQLNPATFEHLPGLVSYLHQLLPAYESTELQQFIKDFQQRFGQARVPLMTALDPEAGVGYAGLDTANLSSDLIKQVKAAKAPATDEQLPPTFKLLLPKLADPSLKCIDLESLPLPATPNLVPLPNSIPVLCAEADGLLEFVHIGGPTANNLLGRFTLAMDTVLQQSRNIAAQEQKANPEVRLFDIDYQTDSRTDNVNRRRCIYEHHLSILNFDESANPLTLDDLDIWVENNELILWSRSRSKRLIPKLASAYNYTLSKLAVFRLLCDLQHQGSHKNLYLKLIDRIPDLPHYPRVQYKNIVVSSETWRLNYTDLGTDPAACRQQFPDYLKGRGMSGYVNVTRGDQTLCIDLNSAHDLDQLWIMLSRNKQLVLTEAFIPRNSKVTDSSGRPYTPEFMLCLQHHQELYKAPVMHTAPCSTVQRHFMPGTDWLYYELYCHELRADQLLLHLEQTVLNPLRSLIRKFFFIRYQENGSHLRLRFQLHTENDSWALISAMTRELTIFWQNGMLANVMLKTYEREIERYGAAQIEVAEQHFEADSLFVLTQLAQALDDDNRYLLSITLVKKLLDAKIIEPAAFKALLKRNMNGYCLEHGLGPRDYGKLNLAYKDFAARKYDWPEARLAQLDALADSFSRTLKAYPEAERPAAFGSLFHMHINRFFPADQRSHETLIYYFLDRELKKQEFFKAPALI